MGRSTVAEENFKNQVFRRCCRCKYTKRVQTDFTPTSRRCTTCAPIYYAELAARRLAGEPPRQKKPKPVPKEKVKYYHSPEFVEEFKAFFRICAAHSDSGLDGQEPAVL